MGKRVADRAPDSAVASRPQGAMKSVLRQRLASLQLRHYPGRDPGR